jgi:hypothetical protein
MIEDLQATVAELQATIQAMEKEKEEMAMKEKGMEERYSELSEKVDGLMNTVEEAKRITSQASVPAKHERFNQQKGEIAPAKAKDEKPKLVGAARLIAEHRNRK